MPRKILQRFLPDPATLRSRRELRFLGGLLDDPFLLHLNRRSVAGACALGLFVAFIPVPGQMPIAALLAILLRVNLVLSLAMVWTTNPITMPPIFYFCYRVGSWLLGNAEREPFQLTLEWFWLELGIIWQPFLLGCFVVGTIVAALAYTLVQLLWRLHVMRTARRRRSRREQN
jgi:uncharacterized protein (DUF2062 family)